ncbi:MAG: zinc ribbon domain-containing protein [Bacteroides sp.]|nr:zinc ribbon domain-containing protein [Bacillota bacterium]MCM1393306.1 zinc ribbon domain-containing protein [[Eubacterium] siraeum]MCM1455724.1 zinc ribbon domain-containing protein [Bacteroides sp.]
MPKCINCGNEFSGNFCPNCGAKAETGLHCPNCGKEVSADVKFCSNCGQPISAVAQTAPVSAPISAAQTEELQNELYSLYKILEPVRALDEAGDAVDAKIKELSDHSPEANKQFYDDFAHYAPFISVDLDEDFLTPEAKINKKEWKEFIKNQKKKLYGKKYDDTGRTKYSIEGYKFNDKMYTGIYNLFKANEDRVLSDLGASFLYYKMDYCYNPDVKAIFYKPPFKGSYGWIRDYTIIGMRNFVFKYLKEKRGDDYDDYLYALFTNLKGGNRGEEQLHDIPRGYDTVNQSEYHDSLDGKEYDYFFLRDGFPETKHFESYIYNINELEAAAKKNTQKSMHKKKELDGSIAELKKIRANINASIEEYMKTVDAYIADNVKITPITYARSWFSVAYMLHLIVNKRGRDIYEVINQYEVDMKHKEITSALGDIHSEIRSQTHILGSKLNEINRSIIKQTDAITSAIYSQTRTLSQKLDTINYSVVSTGASIVGSIAELGKSMGQAMSNMQFNVSVS